MSAVRAAELGAPVRARILASASCGVDPSIMGIGPVPAVRKAMERAGRSESARADHAKVLDEMERRDLELGLVTPCIGGGQGIALLLGR